MNAQTIEQLTKSFGSRLLRPQDDGYDAARRVHNGSIDKQPTMIAQCRSTADIADAVKFARHEGLEIAVRGGGHNVAGNAVCNDGIMIDLATMKGAIVDPMIHRIRCQGGVTWGEFNRETQIHGLASTGGAVSSTGVAGLTLGGGLGWLMGKYGLALDNLVSAEIVTANGDVVMASAEHEPDLFWAIRGGGGNFGVAASFEFQVYPVGPTVIGGVVAHAFSDARGVLRYYRELTVELPDELTVFC
ncbi:MAG: FAD-binding oxidoreductase, partial [Pseudomonadales bacterium]